MSRSIVYSRPFGRLILRPLVARGYRRYRATGTTPRWAYRAMRKLFAADPDGFELLVAQSRSEHTPLEGLDAEHGLAAGAVDEAVAALERDGIFVLPTRLGESDCSELEAAALAADCTVIGPTGVTSGGRARFVPSSPPGVRLDLAEGDILAIPAVQRILADESLLAVAQCYLGAAPVQDMVAMWWSAASPAGPSSAAAQLFHFDLDRLRFVKVFFYLTDVGEGTGPHAFVRGSHRSLPSRFRRDRRYADDEVTSGFAGSTIRVAGGRGTVFLADTRALHKGEPLIEGHRLVFQIEYATSLFGQDYTRAELRSTQPALASAATRFPATYSRYRRASGDRAAAS